MDKENTQSKNSASNGSFAVETVYKKITLKFVSPNRRTFANNRSNLAQDAELLRNTLITQVPNDPEITTLNLSGNNLSGLGEQLSYVFEPLKDKPNITTIELRANILGNLSLDNFSHFLKSISHVKKLDLANNALSILADKGQEKFLQAFVDMPEELSVYIQYNNLKLKFDSPRFTVKRGREKYTDFWIVSRKMTENNEEKQMTEEYREEKKNEEQPQSPASFLHQKAKEAKTEEPVLKIISPEKHQQSKEREPNIQSNNKAKPVSSGQAQVLPHYMTSTKASANKRNTRCETQDSSPKKGASDKQKQSSKQFRQPSSDKPSYLRQMQTSLRRSNTTPLFTSRSSNDDTSSQISDVSGVSSARSEAGRSSRSVRASGSAKLTAFPRSNSASNLVIKEEKDSRPSNAKSGVAGNRSSLFGKSSSAGNQRKVVAKAKTTPRVFVGSQKPIVLVSDAAKAAAAEKEQQTIVSSPHNA